MWHPPHKPLRVVNMKSSIAVMIGGALVILGCCALAFVCLLASFEWGGCQTNGSCFFTLPILDREVRPIMTIFALIGLGGIGLGLRIRRIKAGGAR